MDRDEPPVYVSTGRVAERLGVGKPVVANWVTRCDDVPEPDAWLQTPRGEEWALYLHDGQALVDYGVERMRRQAETARRRKPSSERAERLHQRATSAKSSADKGGSQRAGSSTNGVGGTQTPWL